MNRTEALQQIVSVAVVSSSYYRICVCLPSIDAVREFREDLVATFMQVPVWVAPKMTYNTTKRIEYINGRIDMYVSPCSACGQSYSMVYCSSDLTYEQRNKWEEQLLPALIGTAGFRVFTDL